MGVQEIAEKIKDEGNKEIQKIEEHYSSRVSEILKNQQHERKLFLDTELTKIQKEANEIKTGILVSAKLDGKKSVLQAKRKVIKDILDYTKSHFKTLLGKEAYSQFLLDNIKKNYQNEDQLILSKDDYSEFAEKISKEFSTKIQITSGSINFGFIIIRKHYNLNFSIDALIEQQFEAIEEIIGKELNVF